MPTGTLEVIIADGRHLKDRDIIGKNDAYVEVYLDKKYKQRTIADGRHLKDRDIIGKNDAYVEVYLDKKYKQRTTIIKNSNDPIWNERFSFNIHKGDDTIHFDVYDDDLVGRDSVGNCKVKLKHVFDGRKFDEWVKLPAKLGLSSHGEIHIIMNFTPV
ncbi:unnamed protein product [Rotaria socialis]|uniref:C2 domain-containing protein n=1 Tax=Rotaria socialis TaxID=392032 RepID=A0A818ALD7_9BILA|nr:unnamed protein product [Rotaria socialis]CAF4114850.1 unnamed protein product [Rotaria socialis]